VTARAEFAPPPLEELTLAAAALDVEAREEVLAELDAQRAFAERCGLLESARFYAAVHRVLGVTPAASGQLALP
jgi:hypothetical protein